MAAVALLAIACSGGAAGGANAAGADAFLRVNQVGYTPAGAKTAFLMSPVAENGARFVLRDASGHAVLRGDVGASSGAWSDAYPDVYPIDLSAVTSPGDYTISVAGPAAAAAVPVRIGSGAAIDSRPLANALAFYQVQRDGPDYIPSPLRTAPGHLNDRTAMTYRTPKVDGDGVFAGDLKPLGRTIDASGGWWDAGDYLKFLHTTTYTDALLLAGVRDFPAQMGRTAGPADFTAEARFGAQWLLRMWDDHSRTLYYQVGIGTGNDAILGDHDIWRLPQDDDTYGGSDPQFRYVRNRPVFRAGPPGSLISPNLAGRESAALALCYQVFRTSRPAFAHRCLVSAEHVFDLADTHPGQLLTAIPYDFYPETEWRDDLELGATELARALQAGPAPAGLPHRSAAVYLRTAARWARAYIDGLNDARDTLNLYDVSGFAHYELVRALDRGGNPAGLAVSRGDLIADMGKQLDGAVAQSANDPFGFGFGWAQYDTTSHGAGLAVMASEYDQLTHGSRYASDGARWLGNILGANAWGSSFIIGDGTTYPNCPQHQVANIIGSLDGSPPALVGAAVEGPNRRPARGRLQYMRTCPADGVDRFAQFNSTAVYKDDVQSYSTVEPAIDLTATSPLAFARQAAGL